MADETFGDRLKKALAIRGMKQAELARRIGVGAGTISRYLSEERGRPDAEIVSRIAEELRFFERWLARGVGPMSEDAAEAPVEPQSVEEAKRAHPDRWSDVVIRLGTQVIEVEAKRPKGGVVALLDDIKGIIDARFPVTPHSRASAARSQPPPPLQRPVARARAKER